MGVTNSAFSLCFVIVSVSAWSCFFFLSHQSGRMQAPKQADDAGCWGSVVSEEPV